MRTKKFSGGTLLFFVLIVAFVFHSCSSTYDSASYPMIYKMKDQKFASNFKHPKKIKADRLKLQETTNPDDKILCNEFEANKGSTIDQVTCLKSNTQPSNNEISKTSSIDNYPDIASINNDLIPAKRIKLDKDQSLQQFYAHYENAVNSFNTRINSKKHFNASESVSSSKEGERGGSPAFGIISFVTGLVSLLILPLLFGGIAVVFGAIGFNKQLKGLAIAGFILGIISIIWGIFVLAG